MKMLMNDATIDAIVSALMTLQDAENTALPLYEKQLREVKSSIDNLLNAIQQGIFTRSTKERLDELETCGMNSKTKSRLKNWQNLELPKNSSAFSLNGSERWTSPGNRSARC